MPVFIEIFLFHLPRFSIIYYKFLHFIYTFTLFLYIYLDKFPEIFRNRSPPRKLFHLQHPSNTILHWVNQRKEGGNETRLFPRNNPMILRINAPASDPPVIRKRADVPRNAEENAKIGWPRLKERGDFRFDCSRAWNSVTA